MNKLLLLSIFIVVASSCCHSYNIEGSSSFYSEDGEKMYLKVAEVSAWRVIDSCDIIHGSFKMSGDVDSVIIASLFMGEENIMPVVVEAGKIHITINNTTVSAKGTPLNNNLYNFIFSNVKYDNQILDFERRINRLKIKGATFVEVKELDTKLDSVKMQKDELVSNFMNNNYNNILGPSVFLMLCSTLPYPMLTPKMEQILEKAPRCFIEDPRIKEYLTIARENMLLISTQH